MNLLFRTDASVAVGTGHVMRCMALAQACQDAGGRAVFAIAESTPAIEERLSKAGLDIVAVDAPIGSHKDAVQTEAHANEQRAEWIVADGYRFTFSYQQAVRTANHKLLLFDDYGHSDKYAADLVLNQNLSANVSQYRSREPYTRLLLGTSYALLRREFARWREWKREIAPVCRRLLVMMGGSDPENITARVLAAALSFENLEKIVVVGGSNPHAQELERLAAGDHSVTILRDVRNMPELMASADVAISAAGSTCWELCFMALPSLLIDVASNQSALARELDRTGCALHIGDRTVDLATIGDQLSRVVESMEFRRSLSERSRHLVDGRGAERVIREMSSC